MLIRLNFSGIFTKDMEVSVLPVKGNSVSWAGKNPRTGEQLYATGYVANVIHLLGDEQPAPVAIVIVQARVLDIPVKVG